MSIVQFSGESNWDALINRESLDIEEEDAFEEFVIEQGGSKSMSLEELEKLWHKFNQ